MKKTGQITIETAGTAVQGPSTPKASDFMISAHPDNTGNIAYGNDGNDDVTMSNGYVLKPGKVNFTYFFQGGSHSLDVIWFDADNDGDKVCWVAVE